MPSEGQKQGGPPRPSDLDGPCCIISFDTAPPLHHRTEDILLQKTRQFGADLTVERKFDAKSMLGMLRRYEATVGDLFAVVPPLMSRESVKTADIDGVTLRRISVKDLTEGILMLEDKVEGVELIRVDAAELTVTACVRAISSC